jgi:glutamate synthase domain-containing protein 3
MSGFMAQKGRIVVCGNAGRAFADSMYETVCYVGGRVDDLGNDAVIEEITAEDITFLETTLARYFPDKVKTTGNFKKVVAGRKLWNFKTQERTLWREAM